MPAARRPLPLALVPLIALALLAPRAAAQPLRVSGPPVVSPFAPTPFVPSPTSAQPPPASASPASSPTSSGSPAASLSPTASVSPSSSPSVLPPGAAPSTLALPGSQLPSPSPSPSGSSTASPTASPTASATPTPSASAPAPPLLPPSPRPVVCDLPFRNLDGSCTTLSVELGAVKRGQFSYGLPRNSKVPTSGLPSARLVSNIVCRQAGDIFSRRGLNEMVTFMGQFLDHSIIITPVASEEFNIPIPRLDPVFANFSGGVFRFDRSQRTTDAFGNERPINLLSSAIDLASVYGTDTARLVKLRANVGGRMLTSAGNLLPLNTNDLKNLPSNSAAFFVAGDLRVNENLVLTSLHTLFLREHNRLAEELQRTFPFWSDEKLFQHAKLLNTAQYQKIIFEEYYPAMTGRRLPRYRGFRADVDPTVSDVFGAMAFRIGHTMVGNQINRRWHGNAPMPAIPFTEMFFRRADVFANGIEPFLRGAIFELSQEVDVHVVDALRNFLFTNVPEERGFDLMALNLQRSRDHALPLYNELRALFGIRRVTSFGEITRNRALQGALHSAYGSVDRVEGIIGLFAEEHVQGASMGATMLRMWTAEFMRLRDGDRFFFQRIQSYPAELWGYPGLRLMLKERDTFKKVLLRNTNISSRDLRGSVWKAKVYRGYKPRRKPRDKRQKRPKRRSRRKHSSKRK